ncbi:unnamed protein product [Lasius platythorax]|uniref:THAP-type domain-containing protein n=1 Tax=Lasius platythorax TaxID=488582 RepID=A0AAV2NPP7_9HYME
MVRHCSYSGCKVKEKQGLKLFRFPNEPERRAKWISLINRSNWKPFKNSVLCETHFGEDQWEQKRVDGLRKLRCSAIPSLLCLEEDSQPAPYHHVFEHNYSHVSSVSAASLVIDTAASSPVIDTAASSPVIDTAASSPVIDTAVSSPVIDSTEKESLEILKWQLELQKKKNLLHSR